MRRGEVRGGDVGRGVDRRGEVRAIGEVRRGEERRGEERG